MHLADFLAVNQQPTTALVFVVPMPPTLTNSGKGRSRHWRAMERELWGYLGTLDGIALVHDSRRQFGPARAPIGAPEFADCVVPPVPVEPLTAVWLTSDMVLGGAMDDDNAVARHKWLIDWLVARGYLASDRRTCVRWAAFPTQTVSRKQPARITLTLTPRSET
jgi:hypothetical protein